MIRGRWIIDRALEARLVRPSEKLLVVGAGAAGVTAAIEGVTRGLLITLIDTASGPFMRQAGCSSRWIDPTQYDWPLDHWPNQRFPWTGPAMALGWRAARANVLAILWSWALARATTAYAGSLDVRFGTKLVGFPSLVFHKGKQVLEANFNPSKSPGPEYFEIAVSTVGFGTEQTYLGSFSSYQFWDTDQLEVPDYGLSSIKQPSILISGGGDGALQDFIRTSTTAPSARQVYDSLPLNAAAKATLESALQGADDQAQRAYLWGTRGALTVPARDHAIHEKLHQIFIDAVDRLARDRAVWPLIVAVLHKTVRSKGTAKISLIFPCNHFDRCYALNRFLVLLLERYYQLEHGMQVLYPNVRIDNIVGQGHICANNPIVCYGKRHTISFKTSRCLGLSPHPTSHFPDSEHEIILLRHGIDPPVSVYGSAVIPVQLPRQMIPYYSPW